jgi:hypothetical protein
MKSVLIKKLLIIKAVSMQQLDGNLQKIEEMYPDCLIDVLTHQHSVDMVKCYPTVNEVIPYNYNRGFSIFRRVKDIEEYDYVIITVGNYTAKGFKNVLLFATTIKASEYWICNVTSDLSRFSKVTCAYELLKNLAIYTLAIILTILFAPFIFLIIFKHWLEK